MKNHQIQELQVYLEGLRTSDWENAMHSLIDMGEQVVPYIMNEWLAENDAVVRERLLETMSEMPTKEAIPLFEQKLLNGDTAEVQFAVLALVKFDVFQCETKVMETIRSHPRPSKEKQFVDYLESAIKSWKSRRQ